MFLRHARKYLIPFTLSNSSSILHKSIVNYCFSTSKSNSHSAVVSELLIQKHQFSPQAASRVASRLSHVKDTQNSDSFISFFKHYGFSQTQLERVVGMCPHLLITSFNEITKPKFKCFQDFGFSESEIVEIFTKQPSLLQSSLSNRIAPGLTVLNDLLGSHAQVVKILMKPTGWFLHSDLEKTLLPNIEYLTSCGVPMDQIRRYFCGFSRFFLIKPETMKQYVEKADQLGADRSSGMFLHSVRVVSSMSDEVWECKLQGLRELGLSEDDIRNIFRKAPVVFAGSLEKVNTILELLITTGKYTMQSIISKPVSLMVSVEKRYKPRLQVLEVLEHRKLIEEWPSLSALCTMSDEKFFEKFADPYMEESVARRFSKEG